MRQYFEIWCYFVLNTFCSKIAKITDKVYDKTKNAVFQFYQSTMYVMTCFKFKIIYVLKDTISYIL